MSGQQQPTYVPVFIFGLFPVKIGFAVAFLVAAINHIISVWTKSGIPEPAAEHWLFGLIVCPFMAATMFMNPNFKLKYTIINFFCVEQIIEHMGWILWLNDVATVAQTIQNIIAITFAIVLHFFVNAFLLE